MALRLITDSATDLPKEFIQKHNLHVIPTPVVIDDKDFFDGQTILPENFYEILRSGSDVKTYHINQYMFRQHFEPYAKDNDTLIYFCFSTGIAGTYNAANLAKEELLEDYPSFDLTIIDSKCASIGFGLAVAYLVQFYESGASKEQLIDAARFYFDHMEHIFTVETLDYLFKGGRLSRTAALAGTILDLKPVIEVTDDGKLTAFEKVRGRHKSLKRVVELVGERGIDLSAQTIGIVHGDCHDTMQHVKQQLTDSYGCTNFLENYVGCAIGAHTGPGIIGITFLNEKDPFQDPLKL